MSFKQLSSFLVKPWVSTTMQRSSGAKSILSRSGPPWSKSTTRSPRTSSLTLRIILSTLKKNWNRKGKSPAIERLREIKSKNSHLRKLQKTFHLACGQTLPPRCSISGRLSSTTTRVDCRTNKRVNNLSWGTSGPALILYRVQKTRRSLMTFALEASFSTSCTNILSCQEAWWNGRCEGSSRSNKLLRRFLTQTRTLSFKLKLWPVSTSFQTMFSSLTTTRTRLVFGMQSSRSGPPTISKTWTTTSLRGS